MKIYSSQFLTISFEEEKSRFVQFWIQSPKSISEFKHEMLEYTLLYKKYKPKQTLWLQKKFELVLDANTQIWIEKHVNTPCKTFGNEKLAFVVSKDVIAHINVVNLFERTNSSIIPKHFSSRKNAENWLNDNLSTKISHVNPKISFEGTDAQGNSIFNFKTSSTDLTKTMNSFNNLLETNDYIKLNLHKYTSLTKRERDVLQLYAEGLSFQEIANKLFLSLHTIRTHWKNIKRKTDNSSSEKLLVFAKAFNSRDLD